MFTLVIVGARRTPVQKFLPEDLFYVAAFSYISVPTYSGNFAHFVWFVLARIAGAMRVQLRG